MRRAALGLALLLTTGCFRTTGINRFQPNMYSVDQEIGMGKQMSKEIEKETPLIRHQRLTQLVQGIGQTLAEHAQDPEFKQYPYTFKVVDSSEVNAFSLPGGTVTSAAVVMVGVFAIFATLPILDMKEMGIGLATAVLIDATIVRAVLLPAAMKLLGDANWYLPHWLEWLPHVEVERPVEAAPVADL
jgi:uncharacterized membrane protein YdfJ with MMPL/SSD domain